MIKYYSNRELSDKLNINLAKWKRWSREFLPPDPLGGLQSGYARQYHPNDAFTVFLGGQLVSALRYTIPETRIILSDLKQWLLDKRFYLDLEEDAAPIDKIDPFVCEYRVFINKEMRKNVPSTHFNYIIRGIISDEPSEHNGFSIRNEKYIETRIDITDKNAARLPPSGVKILYITEIYRCFTDDLAENSMEKK
ncbi:hypothetical protein ACFLZL_01160 [Thermodesulfobacteriota bacterium]